MDAQSEEFKWFVELLNKNSVPYWVYGGTLLRLYREGDLSKSKGDIDIGIWPDEVARLLELRRDIEASGFRMDICYFGWPRFRSFIRNINLIPVTNQYPAKIEISIFRRYDEHWSWATYIIPIRRNDTASLLIRLQSRLYRLAKKRIRNLPRDVFLWNRLFEFETYGIPLRYFDEKRQYVFDHTKYIAPADIAGYLEFIYGDWETPRRDWNYLERYEELAFSKDETLNLLRDAARKVRP